MKSILSNNLTSITMAVVVALVAGPLYKAIVIALQLPLEHLSSMFSAPEAVKIQIKAFATQGVLLALSSFVAFALLLHHKQLVLSFGTRAYFTLLAFIISGVIGSLVYSYPAYHYHYVGAPVELQGNVKATIQFKTLPKRFSELLTECKQQNIQCLMHTVFTENTTTKSTIRYEKTSFTDNSDTPISLDILDKILNKQALTFTFTVQDDTNPLVVRDIGAPILTTRKDTLWHNGTLYSLPYDKSLLVYFKFSKANGEPIAVFF